MGIELETRCLCGHANEYHRDMGETSCIMAGCSCQTFRSATEPTDKEKTADFLRLTVEQLNIALRDARAARLHVHLELEDGLYEIGMVEPMLRVRISVFDSV